MADYTSALKEGTTLFHGTYRIERVLGRGGFGITYVAVNTQIGAMVAIKEFFPKGMLNRVSGTTNAAIAAEETASLAKKLKSKFIKEARRLASLKHESIVTVTNAFEENGTAYYVMEFVEGSDLNRLVAKEGALTVKRAVGYVTQVGNALEYLHSLKINHLDVKPANILVDPATDRVILIDFGLSKQYDDGNRQTSTTPVGVSEGYAPIEQYRAGGVNEFSAATDVYSLGATLYFLLTAKQPPSANDLIENGLPFPSKVSNYMRAAISRAMATRRADRYRSVSEFLYAIKGPVRTSAKPKTAPAETTRLIDTPAEATRLINQKPATPKPKQAARQTATRPQPQQPAPRQAATRPQPQQPAPRQAATRPQPQQPAPRRVITPEPSPMRWLWIPAAIVILALVWYFSFRWTCNIASLFDENTALGRKILALAIFVVVAGVASYYRKQSKFAFKTLLVTAVLSSLIPFLKNIPDIEYQNGIGVEIYEESGAGSGHNTSLLYTDNGNFFDAIVCKEYQIWRGEAVSGLSNARLGVVWYDYCEQLDGSIDYDTGILGVLMTDKYGHKITNYLSNSMPIGFIEEQYQEIVDRYNRQGVLEPDYDKINKAYKQYRPDIKANPGH